MMYLPCFPLVHVLELLAVGHPVLVLVIAHDEEVVGMVQTNAADLRVLVIDGLLLDKDPGAWVVKIVKSLTVRKVVEIVNEVVVQVKTCGTCRRTQNGKKGERLLRVSRTVRGSAQRCRSRRKRVMNSLFKKSY